MIDLASLDLSVSQFIVCSALAVVWGFLLTVFAAWLIARGEFEEALLLAEITNSETPTGLQQKTIMQLLKEYDWRAPWHLLIAASSGFIAALFLLQFGFSLGAFTLFFFTSLLLVLAFIDAQTKMLPDPLVYTLLWVGLLIQLYGPTRTVGHELSILGAVTGYLVLWTSAFVFHRFTKRQGLGHGDMKLVAAIGAWFGPFSVVLTLLAGSALALVWHAVQMVRGRIDSQTAFPFGPWLAGGGIAVAWLYGSGNYF
jgi:prepilin signal peptidase PulO-like enzyme (type II secretory pathway)